MSFRPSALSNPKAVPMYRPRMPFSPGMRAPIVVPQTLEEEKKEEGLSMPVKVAIGAGVAAVLGLLVYRLVR